MSTPKVVVLLSLCVVLATAKPAADKSLESFSAMEKQTLAANKALAALPAACTVDSARSIQQAKLKMFGDFASCSVFALIDDIAYMMIDFSNFGSAVFDDVVSFWNSFGACSNETNWLKKLDCYDDVLFSSGNTFQTVNNATKALIEEFMVLIPDIESKFKSCKIKSTTVYNLFLDDLVKKATTC